MENADLAPPLAPPQLTEDEALAVARNDGWEEWLFRHPLSFEYGSHFFESLVRNGQPVGRIDVWVITIREVSIRHAGGPIGLPEALRPPPITTLTIYIDDKARKVVLATGS